MRKTFQEQLSEAEFVLVEMAGLVLEQVERVVTALETRDEAHAEAVINADDPIDERYIGLEETIFTLLATQAPVASDLRLVSAIWHSNGHLERIGDLCVNIAKFLLLAPDFKTSEEIVGELVEMARQAGRMVDSAVQAFSRRDLDLALKLPRMDESINRLNRNLFKTVAKFADDEASIEWGSRMILASRQLERMGDHAVDIGEQVAFMITGEFREFTDASAKELT